MNKLLDLVLVLKRNSDLEHIFEKVSNFEWTCENNDLMKKTDVLFNERKDNFRVTFYRLTIDKNIYLRQGVVKVFGENIVYSIYNNDGIDPIEMSTMDNEEVLLLNRKYWYRFRTVNKTFSYFLVVSH